eukprot:6649552-Alexandrium_andersonii.AAC.1
MKSPPSQKLKRTSPEGSGWRPSLGLMTVPTMGTPSEGPSARMRHTSRPTRLAPSKSRRHK